MRITEFGNFHEAIEKERERERTDETGTKIYKIITASAQLTDISCTYRFFIFFVRRRKQFEKKKYLEKELLEEILN